VARLPTPVGLTVAYGGKTERIQPGDCYEFRARDVRLTPSQALPMGAALDVSIEPVAAKDFRNGATQTAAADHVEAGRSASNRTASEESIKQLSDELEQDDKEMRQATAELNAARARLAKATQELKQAQSKEWRVASAERQTATAERQEQQNRPQAERSTRGQTRSRGSAASSAGMAERR